MSSQRKASGARGGQREGVEVGKAPPGATLGGVPARFGQEARPAAATAAWRPPPRTPHPSAAPMHHTELGCRNRPRAAPKPTPHPQPQRQGGPRAVPGSLPCPTAHPHRRPDCSRRPRRRRARRRGAGTRAGGGCGVGGGGRVGRPPLRGRVATGRKHVRPLLRRRWRRRQRRRRRGGGGGGMKSAGLSPPPPLSSPWPLIGTPL
jgi:hypothetical protein